MRALFDHVFWERGFRPFFFLGACQSVLSLVLWAGFYKGSVTLADSVLDPVSWHAHEMIFGFCMAIVAGFLLTAVANWTGWLPVRKSHLAFLAFLWLIGRVVVTVDLNLPHMAVIVLNALFVPALAASLAVPLLKSWSVRNFIFLALLSVIAISDVIFLITENKIFLHVALMVILTMVSLIGGRIIPAFTVATLRRRGNRVFQTDQNLLTGLSVCSLVLVTIAMAFGQGTLYLSSLSFLAATLHLLRMRHYHVFRSLVDPMLWILHA